MAVFLRDCSHYDSNTSLAGYLGATHKVTEGTSYVDPMAEERLTVWHYLKTPVLGSYHVLHTGNLQAQLDHWVSTLDGIAPWWRTHPHWIMQIDAERWPQDNVSPDTVLQFARMLATSGLPGWKVTYASRGQYGDSLKGLATPLWNADYRPGATYRGDGYVTHQGTPAGWAPYSGVEPVLWQYTSTPYDRNAFRGTADQLLALISGGDPTVQFRAFQVQDHTWYYISFNGMCRRFVGDQAQYTNWVKNHGWPEGVDLTPVVVSPQDLDTLAGPCLAGPDPASTGTLDDIRTRFTSSVSITPEQLAQLEAVLGPVVHAELAKVGITLTVAP